ncbi:MAG: hypothetical protein ACAI34_07475 [Verrucomicrobium sp.]
MKSLPPEHTSPNSTSSETLSDSGAAQAEHADRPSLGSATGWVKWVCWGLVIAPALWLLGEMVPLLVSVPCLDAWSFVQQYQHWVEDRYSWAAFLAPHYVHPSAVGKVIYFTVLHAFGGNVAILPVLSWLFTFTIAFCVCRLAHPLWHRGKKSVHIPGMIVLACATLILFTAAQGEVWLWDFVFQNFIPGTCLAAGLWLITGRQLNVVRLLGLSVLSIIAIFSFGTGFFVPALLAIPLALVIAHQGWSRGRMAAALTLWLAVHAAIAWFALSAPGGSEDRVGLDTLLDRPLMRLHFVLIVLGNILGKGRGFEMESICVIFGGTLLLCFAACVVYVIRQRRHRDLVARSTPWIVLGLYGIASAFLISLGRMHNSLDNALDERFATFDVFFVLGCLMLAATVLRDLTAVTGLQSSEQRVSSKLAKWVQPCAVPAFVVLVLALLVNWDHGHQLMMVKHSRMEQERALLTFANVMPLNKEWMDARVTRKSSAKLAGFLKNHDRLRGVEFAKDRSIEQFKRGPKIGAKWARLDRPVETENGDWQLSGLGGLAVDDAADLVLVTAQTGQGTEQIVAITATVLPANFFEREKQVRMNPEYFLGWSQVLPHDALPEGNAVLRAYVFDQEDRTVHPMQGSFEVGRTKHSLARTPGQ